MRYLKLPTSGARLPKKKSKILKKFWLAIIIIACLVFGAHILATLSGSAPVVRYIFQGGTSLKSNDGKVNILLLGNAGGVHDGAYLTDTVIVTSYDLKHNKAYLISLPRDLWIDKIKSKLNAVYEIGDAKKEGLKFSESVLGEILGIPIHYTVRLDFRGFVKAINEVGGIDVDIEKSFQDNLYPITGRENDLCGFKEEEKEFNEEEAKKLNIEKGKKKVLISPDGKIATDSADPDKGYQYFGCRYEVISFKSGITHMDGDTALKFVRSRMGNNGEGSDFARSKRQQKVIEAFKKKVLSLETVANPSKIKGLIEAWGISLETDIPINDMLEIYKLTKKVKSTQSFVLGNSGKNALLVNPVLQDYGGAWVLVPKGGNFNEVQEFVRKILRGEVTEYEATSSARPSNP